ncbi:hypothetical protein DPMN_053428 [Dreissena polymorpha]|uniref:Uncharacterized protein n=1 Tax=Dreissena polymorpha TaxID=45954 RepID=A0A9D4CLB9_DREPO|nr:hypothetical protein DPMN_053428 [Dreissena polymorpha]
MLKTGKFKTRSISYWRRNGLSPALTRQTKEKKKNKPRVRTEIMDLCDKRRELRHEKYTSLDSNMFAFCFLT